MRGSRQAVDFGRPLALPISLARLLVCVTELTARAIERYTVAITRFKMRLLVHVVICGFDKS